MNYKFPFFVLAVGVLIAGVSPFAMSQVQEDAFMEIDMLQTQVENPFRIQDYQGFDVFAIDNTGHPTIEHDMRQFEYSSGIGELLTCDKTEAEITTTTDSCVLRYWDLSYDNYLVADSFPVFAIPAQGQSMEARYTGNVAFCYVAMQYSNDGGTFWLNFDSSPNSKSSPTFSGDSNWDAENGVYDVTDLRIIMYTNTGDECEFRNISASLFFHIPDWITLTKVK